jgi:hypothetical protein
VVVAEALEAVVGEVVQVAQERQAKAITVKTAVLPQVPAAVAVREKPEELTELVTAAMEFKTTSLEQVFITPEAVEAGKKTMDLRHPAVVLAV